MSDYPKAAHPINLNYVRSESPSRTEYAVKDELFLEHCPLFASKKTIYWYRLIHPVDALHLGAEQQGEIEFHHSIRRPKKSLATRLISASGSAITNESLTRDK